MIRLDNQQYRGVSSGQAPSCHIELKGWGPLRLCLFIICICTSVDIDSRCSSCRSQGPVNAHASAQCLPTAHTSRCCLHPTQAANMSLRHCMHIDLLCAPDTRRKFCKSLQAPCRECRTSQDGAVAAKATVHAANTLQLVRMCHMSHTICNHGAHTRAAAASVTTAQTDRSASLQVLYVHKPCTGTRNRRSHQTIRSPTQDRATQYVMGRQHTLGEGAVHFWV
jgi:hypothetical protein